MANNESDIGESASPAPDNVRGGDELAIHDRMIQNIRTARNRLGLSQMEVCLRGGFSQSFYAQVESGKVKPSAMTVIRIALALGISPRDLFPAPQNRPREEVKREICALLEAL